LTEIDRELDSLNQQLGEKALTEEPGSKILARLVGQREKLTQESELLHLRLSGLERQHALAERGEAAERLTAIAAELGALTAEGERETARFAEAITHLTALILEAGERRQYAATLMDEGRYLATLHDLESPLYPAVPMPNREEADQFARLVRDVLTMSTGSPWAFKLDTLRRERAEEAARNQPKPTLQVNDQSEPPSVVLERVWKEREEERRRNTL
jgi:hypothetical protein